MATQTISIIIPTAGNRSPKMLDRTLASLSKEDIPESLVNIIVVENGGVFGVKEICKKFSEILPILYFYDSQPSSSNARNIGINKSSSDFLIFFDDDIRLAGKTLRSYANAFKKYGTGHFFGGPLAIDYETPPNPDLIEFFPASVKGFDLGTKDIELSTPKQLFLGGNQAFPRHLLIKTKGYDQLGTNGLNSGYIGEETRLQEQMLLKNITGIYIPEAKVWHYVPSDSCTLDWLKTRYFRRGLTEGALLKYSSSTIAEILGRPRFSIASLIKNRIRFASQAFAATTRQKIALSLEYEVIRGQIIGYRTPISS